MRIYFNDLINSLSVNHKKENTTFLLSDKITECLNTITKDNFFILEGKGKDKEKSIYIDKGFLHKMKSELINVIKDYTKDNSCLLKNIFSVNYAYKTSTSSISRENNSFPSLNLDSLDDVQDFISRIIKGTHSSTLRESIFNKDTCPTIHMFLKKRLLGKGKSEIKSLSLLIKNFKNKTIVLNTGCELPYQLDNHNNILLVKFGNLKAADYNVTSNDESYKLSKVYSCKDNNSKKIKNIITEFEIHFNFLNKNIKQYHEIVDNSCFFTNVKEINEVFNFIDGNVIEYIKKKYYKCDDLWLFNNELIGFFNKINNNCKELDLYYKKNIFNFNDTVILNLNVDNLEHKLKEIKSNTELLKLRLESLNDFSTCIRQCKNEFKSTFFYLENNNKKIVFDSILKIKEKTNECLLLLDGFIKRKETSFFSKLYKLFFPKKHNESLSVLVNYKSEINKILYYLDVYKEKNEYFTISDISLMVTSKLSKINYPKSLLGYLYGEKRKCDNFIQSLFKKDE